VLKKIRLIYQKYAMQIQIPQSGMVCTYSPTYMATHPRRLESSNLTSELLNILHSKPFTSDQQHNADNKNA